MTQQQKYWGAVVARDQRFDGRFVYAVRSTGIYCRPTCPSRRPGRAQVIFFSRPALAQQAGFRPCRRCEPQAPVSRYGQLIHRVCRYIEQSPEDRLNMEALSRKFNVSASHLQRVFKRLLGVSIASYARGFRYKHFKNAVRKGGDVTTALYEAGFGSGSRLYETSYSNLGMTPAAYKKGGGVSISYGTRRCYLGHLLVAATDRGICAVMLGDTPAQLFARLQVEYPNANISRNNSELHKKIEAVMRHLSGTGQRSELPLDVRATAFQRRVWEELQKIPYGETRSYSEIASGLDMPKGARAVARACAANPVALVIPCHRVVPKRGTSGGYRWGKGRKQRLLAREKRRR